MKKYILLFALIAVLLFLFFAQKKREGLLTDIYAEDRESCQKIMPNIILTDKKYKKEYKSMRDKTFLPFDQCCIKASHNSAYNGSFICIEMIQYVLSLGCRWLDFEVYYTPIKKSANDKALDYNVCVGYSDDLKEINTKTMNTRPITLDYILRKTFDNAMALQNGSPYVNTNTDDPLFIQIRIKTDDPNKENLYKMTNDVIENIKTDNIYSKYFNSPMTNVISSTTISAIGTNVIIVFNYDNDYEVSSKPLYQSEIYKETILEKYMVIGKDNKTLQIISADKIDIKKYPSNTTPKKTGPDMVSGLGDWTIVEPAGYKNINIYDSIGSYGYHVNKMMYYKKDDFLKKHEDVFSNFGNSIIPMAWIVNYIS